MASSAISIVFSAETSMTMPQVTYRLTPRGRELMAALQPLVRWGLRWHGEDEQAEAERDAG